MSRLGFWILVLGVCVGAQAGGENSELKSTGSSSFGVASKTNQRSIIAESERERGRQSTRFFGQAPNMYWPYGQMGRPMNSFGYGPPYSMGYGAYPAMGGYGGFYPGYGSYSNFGGYSALQQQQQQQQTSQMGAGGLAGGNFIPGYGF